MRPMPWQIIRSLRRAVTAGFFWRSDPAVTARRKLRMICHGIGSPHTLSAV
ncbi:hypothetical protein MAHJHV59_49750 [Mycobacterium avium subsp. hominissuis]